MTDPGTDMVPHEEAFPVDGDEYKVLRARAVERCNRLAGGNRQGALGFFTLFENSLQAALLMASPTAEGAHDAYMLAIKTFVEG